MKNFSKVTKRIFAYALVISLLLGSDYFYAFTSDLSSEKNNSNYDAKTTSSNQFPAIDDSDSDIDNLGIFLDEEPEGNPESPIKHDLTKQPIGGTVETDKGKMTWNIDAKGKLTVTGKGQPVLETKKVQYRWMDELYSYNINNCWPWAEYQHDITSAYIDLSDFTSAENMFLTCSNLKEIEFGKNFNTSNVTNMASMFDGCISLTTLNLSNFVTSNVTHMFSMFSYCDSLTKLDLSSFDTFNVTDMSGMFNYCESLTELDLSNFVTSNVTNMDYMFRECNSLTKLDLSSFDTFKVTDMSYMFACCKSLTELDLSNFVTSNVNNMDYMFRECNSLTKLNLSSFDTSMVSNMACMFSICKSLTELNLSNFDTSMVSNMWGMFGSCDALTKLDLSSFDMSKIELFTNFLESNNNLSLIIAPVNLSQEINLPDCGTWMDENENNITSLPTNTTKPIVIQRDVEEAPKPYNPVEIKSDIAKGRGIITPGTGAYDFRIPRTFNFIPDKDYEIESIIIDNEDKGNISSYTFTDENTDKNGHTIVAKYIAKYADVNLINADNVIINGNTKVARNEDIELSFKAKDGFRIIDVIIDGESVGVVRECKFEKAIGTHTIEFKLAKEHCITLINHENVIVTGNLKVYTNENTELSFTAKDGFRITDIIIDGKSVGAISEYKFINVTNNHTIEFKLVKEYTINSSAGDNGKISPNGESKVLEGESITYTITPNKNYVIKDVIVDGKSVGAVCEYTFEKVDGNHTIEASFAEDKPKKEIYTITFDANGGVVNTPTKEVTNGDAYGELPVATKNGAFFTGWYLTKEDGNPITKDTIFDQGKDITLYAHYDYINIAVKQSLDVSKFFDDVENIVSYKVTKVDKGKATVSKKGKLKASKEGTIKVVPCIKDGKKKVTLEEKAITIIITKPKFTQKSITGKVGDKVDVSTFLVGFPANSNTVTYTIPAKKNPAKQVATVNENTGMTNLLRKGKTKLTVHVINEDMSESKITLTIKVKK